MKINVKLKKEIKKSKKKIAAKTKNKYLVK